MRQPADALASRTIVQLKIFDTSLQLLTVLALAVAIFALQTRLPCHLYLLVTPIVPMVVWVCSGLVIDRQSLATAARK